MLAKGTPSNGVFDPMAVEPDGFSRCLGVVVLLNLPTCIVRHMSFIVAGKRTPGLVASSVNLLSWRSRSHIFQEAEYGLVPPSHSSGQITLHLGCNTLDQPNLIDWRELPCQPEHFLQSHRITGLSQISPRPQVVPLALIQRTNREAFLAPARLSWRDDDRRIPETGHLVALAAFRLKRCPESSLRVFWTLKVPKVVGKDPRAHSQQTSSLQIQKSLVLLARTPRNGRDQSRNQTTAVCHHNLLASLNPCHIFAEPSFQLCNATWIISTVAPSDA